MPRPLATIALLLLMIVAAGCGTNSDDPATSAAVEVQTLYSPSEQCPIEGPADYAMVRDADGMELVDVDHDGLADYGRSGQIVYVRGSLVSTEIEAAWVTIDRSNEYLAIFASLVEAGRTVPWFFDDMETPIAFIDRVQVSVDGGAANGDELLVEGQEPLDISWVTDADGAVSDARIAREGATTPGLSRSIVVHRLDEVDIDFNDRGSTLAFAELDVGPLVSTASQVDAGCTGFPLSQGRRLCLDALAEGKTVEGWLASQAPGDWFGERSCP